MSDLFEKLKQLSPERLLLVARELHERLGAYETAAQEPIAIIGASCRFPGAYGLDEYWRLLSRGQDAIGEIPTERRWDKSRYYDPNPDTPGKMYVWRGGFLQNVEYFASNFFGISRREAVRMDPQQRLLLECVWEAIENGAQPIKQLQQGSTGVYIGISTNDFLQLGCRQGDPLDIDPYSGTGTAASIAAGRISYSLGLEGPNFPVDTACSSSLVAMHLACQALRGREADAAIVAAVNLMLSPETTVYFSKIRALSADGTCHTFDAAANGYVRSEGAGALVLKRLSDAIAQRDPILALVRGTAINHDGRTSGLTVPNRAAQERLVRDALRSGGLTPADIQYIEAHGTGTPLGDPIELQALGAVFRESHSAQRPLLVGSVKTNIGHTEAAAGLAGVIKVALALAHRRLPAHLHFQQPNPYIPWAQLPIEVPVELRDWPSGSPLRAGVSSFGFSGTNAHVVMEEAPVLARPTEERPRHLLCLSAKTKPALQQLVSKAAAQLADGGKALADACFTAAAGRTHFSHRVTISASDTADALAQLKRAESGEIAATEVVLESRPKVAFLFSGNPAARRDVHDLFDAQPAFREAVLECERILALHKLELRGQLFAANDGAPLSQPALFVFQYALARLWQDWGVRPGIVLGHSDGEYVAACVAGVMTLEAVLELLVERAKLLATTELGAMLAIRGQPGAIREILDAERRLAVAAVNSADQFVVSGAFEAIERLESLCGQRRIAAQRLAVEFAYHSPLLDPIVDRFGQLVGRLQLQAPTLGYLSSVTGKLEQQALTQPSYWTSQLGQAVQFHSALQTLAQRKYDIVLGIGPTDCATCLVRQVLGSAGPQAVATLRGEGDSWSSLVDAARSLYLKGVDIDWKRFYGPTVGKFVAWPNYQFQREPLLEIPGLNLESSGVERLRRSLRPQRLPS